MANKIINVQLSIPGGCAQPVVAGDKRLTSINLTHVIRNGLTAGQLFGLSGSGAYLQVASSVVAASATATCASVVNGNTISIAGQALTATQRRATGTVTPGTAGNVPVEGDTITLNGVVFTAVNGAVVLGEATFDISGNGQAQCDSITAQVNAYASSLLSGTVKARNSATVVTFYAVTQGTSGNAITLATSDNTRLAKSGTTLANGAAIANNTFDFAGTDATTAAALAAAINASTTAAVQKVVATVSSNVVTITAKVAGAGGNAITLTSVGGTITVTGGGTLASGSDGTVTRWAL